jgi:plasmid stabilization system protein ParE
MTLRFAPRAARGIAEIADYFHVENPVAALRVRTAILNSLDLLISFPEIGRAQNIEGIRKLVIPRYPYLVYDLVDEPAGEIIVLTSRHAASVLAVGPMNAQSSLCIADGAGR